MKCQVVEKRVCHFPLYLRYKACRDKKVTHTFFIANYIIWKYTINSKLNEFQFEVMIMEKKLGIITGILGIALVAIGGVLNQKANPVLSVIGGADGPTSVFIAGRLNVDVYIIVIGIILVAIGGIVLYKHKH